MTARPGGSEVVTKRFRDAMAQVPAAVAVVTTIAGGEPYGTTVSAFMSLSMDPPSVVISLDNTSSLLSRLHLGSKVGINVLAVEQADLAAGFARKAKGEMGAVWADSDGEPPRLPTAHAWIAATVSELIVVGDHTLVVGAVDSAETTPDAPLIYWQRTYGTHTAT